MPVTVNITGSLLPLLRTKVKTLTSMLRLKAPAILFFGSSEVYFYTIPPPFFFLKAFVLRFKDSGAGSYQSGTHIPNQNLKSPYFILFTSITILFLPSSSLSHLPLPPWWQILFKSLRQATSIETGRGNVEILSCPVNSSGMKSHSIVLAVLLRQALLANYFNIVAWKFPSASR